MILIADDLRRKSQASDWEEVRPSQQVLRMKIDDTPRKSPLSRRCARPLLEKREKWRTPVVSLDVKKTNPLYTSRLKWPTRPLNSVCLPSSNGPFGIVDVERPCPSTTYFEKTGPTAHSNKLRKPT